MALAPNTQTILVGHPDVQDQHVRLEVRGGAFPRASATAGEGEVVFQAEELLQGLENERVVISQTRRIVILVLQAASAAPS